MNNIKNWLKRNGYSFNEAKLTGDRKAIVVDTNYKGPYPGKEQFDALKDIQKYIEKHHPGFTVESRGCYTAVFIIDHAAA